jgi:coronin-7
MDKIVVVAFNPVAQDVLLTVSSDRNSAGIRIWDLNNKTEKHHFEHGDVVFDAVWSSDGQQVATTSKSKKIKIFDAVHDFKPVAEGPGHQSIRPAKLLWLGDMNMIASVGFGLGSSREVLVYKLDDLAKGPCFKKNIDISPSVMSAYFDPDCGILYVAGRVSLTANFVLHTCFCADLIHLIGRPDHPHL